ncbi:MAG: phosphoesterase [Chloroflexi bacterium HGW-Chloroflexi-8]|jgi:hypothetical protein|nr:MAG: phosphoesterase [Chloroflexi bacterium HGW-Chloroflexi-8]
MNLLRVETHCHSVQSPDSFNKIEDLIRVAKKRKLNRLVISDHNRIDGALLAKELDPDLIIVGEEILTTQGELLAFFVQEIVPSGLSPEKTIDILRDQNAFISVSHPFDRLRHGWEQSDLKKIVPLIDAIEVFNARSFTKSVNEKAADFAMKNNLAGTVGSDAHTLVEVGRAVLMLPEFHDSNSLRQVIGKGERITRYSSPMVRFGSTYATLIRKIQKATR